MDKQIQERTKEQFENLKEAYLLVTSFLHKNETAYAEQKQILEFEEPIASYLRTMTPLQRKQHIFLVTSAVMRYEKAIELQKRLIDLGIDKLVTTI